MNANELADAIEKGGKDGFFQDEIVAILRQQQAEIEAYKNLVAEQDKKIVELAFRAVYAERGNEVVKEAKYGITTKWDGRTTYHETTEPIGKAQEK
jgi:hypothetical protein